MLRFHNFLIFNYHIYNEFLLLLIFNSLKLSFFFSSFEIETYLVFGAAAVVLTFALTVFLFHLIQFCHGMSDGEQSSGGADHPPRKPNLPQVEVQHIDAYRAPKLPRFFRDDPASFFVVAEAAFRRAHVRTESVKADYIIDNLDHDIIPHKLIN